MLPGTAHHIVLELQRNAVPDIKSGDLAEVTVSCCSVQISLAKLSARCGWYHALHESRQLEPSHHSALVRSR